jgi:hypothetical protein
VVQPFGNRLRHAKNAIAPPARLLPHPFGDTRLVLYVLPNKFPREPPHACELRHGEVTLLEWLTPFIRFHDRPRRERAGRTSSWRPAVIHTSMGVTGPVLLVLPISIENDLLESILSVPLRDPPQQREAATLAAENELTRGKADVLTMAVSSLPNSEADQFQSIELTAREVDLGVCELARGGVTVRLENLNGDRGHDQSLLRIRAILCGVC